MNWIDSQSFPVLLCKKVRVSFAILGKSSTFAPVKNEKDKHS